MLKRKRIRTRGKISLSRFFQIFQIGDRVAISAELSVPTDVPPQMQGKTGKVIGKRGRAYLVRINDGSYPKQYIVHPIHLKRVGAEPEISA